MLLVVGVVAIAYIVSTAIVGHCCCCCVVAVEAIAGGRDAEIDAGRARRVRGVRL